MVHIHNRMLLPVYRAMFSKHFQAEIKAVFITLQCLVCLFNGRGCGAGWKNRYSGAGWAGAGPNNS